MNRRAFLATACASAAPRRQIRIDTHTHLYDPTRPQGVPWPSPKDSGLYRPVLPQLFRQAVAGLGDVRTVVVEASPWVEDNQWLLDLARDEPVIAGIVGNLQAGDPDFRSNVRRFARNPLFRGIRVYPQNALKRLPLDRLIDELRILPEAGLQVDLNGGAGLFADALQIASKVPQLRIVIEHLPYAWPEDPAKQDAARRAFRELAAMPHVYAKVTQFLDAGSAFRQSAVDEVWDAFAPGRVFYGSNWPLSDRVSSYRSQMERISSYVAGHGPDAADQFFFQNAVAAYKLQIR